MSRTIKNESSSAVFVTQNDDQRATDKGNGSDSLKQHLINFEEHAFEKIKEGLDYSRQKRSTLDRGCLWLHPHEADKLNQALEKTNTSDFWHFKELPNDAHHIHIPSSKKEPKRIKNLAGSSAQANRKSEGAPPCPMTRSKPSLAVDLAVETDFKFRKSMNPVVPFQRQPRVSQTQLKTLPDWARRLHHVLLLLCQTEALKPFIADVPAHDPKYSEICEIIRPGLVPIGLLTVVSKLEQNGYQCALDVFNDIYGVWLSFYRRYAPGSSMWLQTFQASRTFLQQIVNQPLKDDFTQASAQPDISQEIKNQFVESNEDESDTNRKTSQAAASVEELLEEFLMLQKQPVKAYSKSGATTESQQRSSAARPSRSKCPRAKVIYPPITDAERETFQACLLQLEAKHHLMLFEAFRKSAVWRSIEGGEVELDDTKTSPPVFRKMIAWCRSQVAVELPPEKRLKFNPSALYLLEKKEPGGGKYVPTLETVGAISSNAAASAVPLQQNVQLLKNDSINTVTQQSFQKKTSFSSSSSSSSSRTVSSSDDDDTEDEKAS